MQPLVHHPDGEQMCFPMTIFSGKQQTQIGSRELTSAHSLLHLGPLLAPTLVRTLPIIPQLVSVTASEDIPTILSVDVQTYCIPGEHAHCDPQTQISLSQHTDTERRERMITKSLELQSLRWESNPRRAHPRRGLGGGVMRPSC